MTVKELIKQLLDYNPNAQVYICDNSDSDIELTYGSSDGCTKENCDMVGFHIKRNRRTIAQEEKAKAYDGAIERAKSKIKNDKNHILYEDDVIEIFPELMESEDEMIRKYIIWHLKHTRTYPDNSINNHAEEAIAWLEKQDKQNPAEKTDVLMSLDEAIEHCKEKSCGNNACALEHKQLEKWLTELMERKGLCYQ